MSSYKDLSEIVKMAVKIEENLKDFYEVAEFAVKNPESKAAIAAIKSRLTEELMILEGVSPKKYGTLEWLKFPPLLDEKEIIPKTGITRSSSPDDIFAQMLASEEKLKEYYTKVSSQLTTRSQKDLFDSLAVFKEKQIDGVRNLMNFKAL